jgi:hypothetical protein
MEKLILGFFLALGIVLLVLGTIILASFNELKDNAKIDDSQAVIKKDSTNLKNSSIGVIVIGVIFTVIAGFGLFRHTATATVGLPTAKQSFRRYYF